MASFRDLLAAAKTQITEIDTAAAEAQRLANPATIVLDVREPDEYEQGALLDVIHIPRGHLEAQVENKSAAGRGPQERRESLRAVSRPHSIAVTSFRSNF